MKRFTLALGLAAVAAIAMRAPAQDTTGTRLAFRPESQLSLGGTSTLHDFSCKTGTIQALVSVDSSYATQPLTAIPRPIVAVDVTIPVKTLKCGHDGMDNNMYDTLHEKDFPTIRYVLASYDLVSGAVAADSFVAKTVGTLTVAGKDKTIEMTVVGRRTPDGIAHATGSVDVNLTDFGIKPPTFFLGTLRVGNKINITFDIAGDRATAMAAGLNLP